MPRWCWRCAIPTSGGLDVEDNYVSGKYTSPLATLLGWIDPEFFGKGNRLCRLGFDRLSKGDFARNGRQAFMIIMASPPCAPCEQSPRKAPQGWKGASAHFWTSLCPQPRFPDPMKRKFSKVGDACEGSICPLREEGCSV